ncbi:MAG: SLC13 family permease [Gammaproteobacteria bacterium]|jgi:di/tricarboxylate transporter|nr:SLC13 family permease [Gammaproteobacteria bacterium]
MNADQWIVVATLVGALVFFAWGRWRYDLVAALALMVVVVTGLVPAREAFAGFGHPAVITVAAVLIISHALKSSGVVDMVVSHLGPLTHNPLVHIMALTGVVTVASAFMNNVGALALMLPVALATASQHQRSPAILLMPLAFGSILGGMTTMIGTPPNIIIASYRQDLVGEPFGLFDFSPVGVVVAVVGVIFVTLIGWRLIPAERRRQNPPQQLFQIDAYLNELRVPAGSELIGTLLSQVSAFDEAGVDVVGLARGRGRAMALPRKHELAEGDVLIARADPNAVEALADELGLERLTSATASFYDLVGDDLALAEGVVTPGSPLVGRDIPYLRRRSGGSVAVVAVARQGQAIRRRLRSVTFKAGDVLLLQAEKDHLEATLSQFALLPLAERGLRLHPGNRVGLALAIFALALAAGVAGWLSLTIAFTLAIGAYVVSGLLPVRELYDAVDWPIIVLLGALIPVGQALEQTGTTTLFATMVVGLTAGLPVWLVLTLVLVVTMFLSDIINNAATALIMAPIAVGIAATLGVHSDPFLMAVAVGASCAFLTPIGHQSNTLVMGPGGYRFTDYWRMGLPLEVLITLLGVPMILYVWPL